ncbi:hypothetical protein BDZ97DRAFT_1824867 [Flammula alnicola]|nr:hypothetical protein BDZ97DRAFT_1824867 [Flammula alnicola]
MWRKIGVKAMLSQICEPPESNHKNFSLKFMEKVVLAHALYIQDLQRSSQVWISMINISNALFSIIRRYLSFGAPPDGMKLKSQQQSSVRDEIRENKVGS